MGVVDRKCGKTSPCRIFKTGVRCSAFAVSSALSKSIIDPAGGTNASCNSPYGSNISLICSADVPYGMFFTRIVVSNLEREEKDERRTPSDSRWVLVSWMTSSARASLTAALSPDSGLRMEGLSILRRLATEDATASLYFRERRS